MSSELQNSQQQQNSVEIDLRQLLAVLGQKKLHIIGISLLFGVLAAAYSLTLPNIYRSEALLAPAGENASQLPGQLGGLAALAGVNLRRGGGADKTTLALEVIKSREFITGFVERHNFLPQLMAAEKWQPLTDTIIYDEDSYHEQTGKWVRDVKPPQSPIPSMQMAHRKFMSQLYVSQEKMTGMVTIAFDHVSASFARDVITKLIEDLNNEMRRRDLDEAERSIAYLKEQINQTSLADARSMLFTMVEEQTKTAMIANIRHEYILKTIDPAIVPERKFKPARAMMILIFAFIGMLTSITVILINFFRRINLDK